MTIEEAARRILKQMATEPLKTYLIHRLEMKCEKCGQLRHCRNGYCTPCLAPVMEEVANEGLGV